MPRVEYIDDPNLILPLVASYNTRGNTGFTQAVTNARDQRKVNSNYEPVKNEATGKVTVYLAKRPGVVSDGAAYGTGGQVPYLWTVVATATTTNTLNRWVFSVSSGAIRASDTTTTHTITTAVQTTPAYVDVTRVTDTPTLVLQLRNDSGIAKQQAFYAAQDVTAFTEITHSTFTALNLEGKAEHLDGYMFVSERRKIYNSALNTVSTWPASNYISRRSSFDIGTGLARLGNLIVSFGDATMEVYRNAGTPFGSPLEALPQMFERYGLPSTYVEGQRHYYANIGGRMYWVGANPHGVFAFNGERVEKVSTPAIDKMLAERQHYFVEPLRFQGKSAIAIGLDLPSATTQRSLLFFPEWNDWFEWSSSVFMPVTTPRLQSVCLGVGVSSNRLFEIATSTAVFQDAGVNYSMTHQFKLPTSGNSRQQLRMFGVKGDTAPSATTSVLKVRFSFDDWQTSTTARDIDMTKHKKHIYRCGAYTDLGVYLEHTGNLDCRLEAAVATVA